MSAHERLRGELIDKIRKWEDSYGSVLLKGCAIRRDGAWVNTVTKVLPLHKSDSYVVGSDLMYGDFLLFEAMISCEDLKTIVGKLPDNGDIVLTLGHWDVKVGGSLFTYSNRYDSGEEYFNVGWCFETYQYGRQGQGFSGEPLVAKDLPLFPDFWTAISAHTGIDTARRSDLYGLIIFLPRYGARIQEVVIGSEDIRVRVEPKDTRIDDLVCKMYYQRGQESMQVDVELVDNIGTASFALNPDLLYVALVSKKDNEILDSRRYQPGWGFLSRGFVVKIPQYELREWIKNGETEGVEFKADIGKPEEFVESVAAFANTRGGVILLGVDDHSNVVGLRRMDYKDSIAKILRSHCEPRVRYDMKSAQIDGKEIIIVRIEEGEDKPYVVKDKGIYVRAHGTDRIATRLELDEMSKKEHSGYPRIM